jgi:dinuclear metal center YbgI/SA1388 family protein
MKQSIVANHMTSVSDICTFFNSFAPPELVEDWDNTGLLLGRSSAKVQRICTCLTLTPDVACDAIEKGVQLIVTHHPVMFQPVQQITESSIEGGILLNLIEGGVAVFSPHTRFDSAGDGINQGLATTLGLKQIRPLRPLDGDTMQGSGRYGELSAEMPFSEFLQVVSRATTAKYLEFTGELTGTVKRVAVACGAAAEFLTEAAELGCDTFVTGEARFHSAIEARSKKINLILTGHYNSERPAVEQLAEILGSEFPGVDVFASGVESDPLQLYGNSGT